jgi:hypothetical protein
VRHSVPVTRISAMMCGVQDYLIHQLRSEIEQVEEDERLIKKYSDETAKLRAETENIKNGSEHSLY